MAHHKWALVAAALAVCSFAVADVVYQTDFEGLTVGLTQPHPGDPGQGGWYQVGAPGAAYGEIQDSIALGQKALHEHIGLTNMTGEGALDRVALTSPDLTAFPLITLSVDFYAHTSDVCLVNPYSSHFEIWGAGLKVLDFWLTSGNSIPKAEGVDVNLTAFTGAMNNAMPLTVGQNLAWDSWHHLELVADQAGDRWISLTVDSQTQYLTEYMLPRMDVGGVWQRGEVMEYISALCLAHDWENPAQESEDDIYWDNLSLTVDVPEPGTLALLGSALAGLVALARRR